MNKDKAKHSQDQNYQHKGKSSIRASCIALMIALMLLYTNDAMAADAFEQAFKKISGWTDGYLGKLIMFISLIGGTIMGALGFSWKTVAGPIGIGLILSLAKAITEMFFK